MPIYPPELPWAQCDEMFQQREGDSYSYDNTRNHVRYHKVVVRYKEMSEISVCLCPDVPKPGTFYEPPAVLVGVGGVPAGAIEWDTQAFLVRQSAKQLDENDWQVWVVKSEYSTNVGTKRTDSPGDSSKDPTLELADVSWDFEETTEVKHYDLNGSPFWNQAKQNFNPPVPYPVAYPVLNISRNELNFNFNKAQQYAFALNDAKFLTAPRGCVMCLPPKATGKNQGPFRYWRTTYKLKFRALQANGGYILPKLNVLIPQPIVVPRPDGTLAISTIYFPSKDDQNFADSWQPLAINQGYYRLGGSRAGDFASVKGKPVPIFVHGHHATHNMLLDEKGDCPQTRPDWRGDVEPPIWYKQFITHRYASFAALLVKGLS